MYMYQICLMKVKQKKKTFFFFYRARSFFMESCGLGREILVPMLAFAHDGRGTNTNVHRYLRDARSSRFTASKHNLFYFTGDLASLWTASLSLPSAVTHLQSLTTGLCPGTGQLTYFRGLSTSNLFALNSLSV
jgi:hypothetical protein